MKIRAKARDKLAHWVWGASRQLPDALLLANPKALASLDPKSETYTDDLAKEVWIYGASDFAEIIEGNNQLAEFGARFRHIINRHPANRRDILYLGLCAEPVLADILNRRA